MAFYLGIDAYTLFTSYHPEPSTIAKEWLMIKNWQRKTLLHY
jgi:hypothetical protein